MDVSSCLTRRIYGDLARLIFETSIFVAPDGIGTLHSSGPVACKTISDNLKEAIVTMLLVVASLAASEWIIVMI